MGIEQLLKEKRLDVLRIAAKHGARNIRLFGSVARQEANEQSDVDFLVEMEPGRSLMDRASLVVELEQLLGCKVDVAIEKVLKERIKEEVLKEAIPL